MVREQLYNMAFIATSTLLIHQCFLTGNSFASVAINQHLESILRRHYQPSYLPITSDVDSLSVLYFKPGHLNTRKKTNPRNDNEEDECPESDWKKPERVNKCCKQKVEECDEDVFNSSVCERSTENAAMTFYTVGGDFCRNTVNKTDFAIKCSKFKVLRAVNLNGMQHTDSRDIIYSRDQPGNVDDPDNVKLGREALVGIEGYGSFKDRTMYTSLVYANVTKLQEGRAACIRYEITLTGDGVHELAVRTVDDESSGVGQRKFNVLLQNVPIFPEVDLFQLTGRKGRAADLIQNFMVTNGQKQIILMNFKPQLKIIEVPQDKKVWLSFCSSNCSNTDGRSFIVSSFSVIRFGDTATNTLKELAGTKQIKNEKINDQRSRNSLNRVLGQQVGRSVKSDLSMNLTSACENENDNPCGCMWIDYCEYNQVTRKCVPRKIKCDSAPKNQCRLRGKYFENYYVVGGEVCQQLDPTPAPCRKLDTVIAFYFRKSKSDTHTSLEGITYESAYYSGRPEYRRDGSEGSGAEFEYIYSRYPSSNMPPEDIFLNSAHIGANADGYSTPCIQHRIPITGNGYYELIIHAQEEHTREFLKHRFAKAMRGDKILLNSVPIVEAFDIGRYRTAPDALNLRVNYKVYGYQDHIQMEGYTESKIERCKKFIPLEYCTTRCQDGVKPRDPYWCIGGFSVVRVGHLPCSEGNGDPCRCKHQINCEYDEASGKCEETVSECEGTRWTADECQRSGKHIFYAIRGQICTSAAVAKGNCAVDKVMLAVNFGLGATDHTDIYRISYVSASKMPPVDPAKSKIDDYQSDILNREVPQQDLQLYQRYAWGKYSNNKMNACISYNIPTAGDGEYEISIKTGESGRAADVSRETSYKLNGQFIVKDFRSAAYAPEPKAMDLNANFRISDGSTKFSLRGQKEVDIPGAGTSLLFEICPAECSCGTINWQIGAFSVIKFKKTKCSDFNHDSCGCRKLGKCQFIVGTGKCVEFDEACSRIFPVGNECRRGGDHIYYVHQGIICHNSVPQGNCEMQKILLAVNFNGGTHTDINGITFQSQQGVRYEDPESVLSLSMDGERFTTEGVPVADLDLYKSYAWGNNTNSSLACVTYYVPTDGDGEYELSFRLVEVWHSGAGLREFLLTFNRQPVVESLDMASVRAVPKGFDMNVNFKVFANARGVFTQMRGHAPALITEADKSVRLSFCPGNCHWEGRNWQVAAFSVIKFEGKIIPPICHEDEIEHTRTLFDYSKFFLKKKQYQ